MTKDVIIKLYHWIAKKRYLGGKYIYTYERLYIPVPRVFHKKFRSILKQHIKMEVEEHKGRIGVFLTSHFFDCGWLKGLVIAIIAGIGYLIISLILSAILVMLGFSALPSLW
jgi:hypothetical protein